MIAAQLIGEYKLVPGERFSYNSETNIIRYVPKMIETSLGELALLHEIAHARLGHFSYTYDLELYSMEIEAWEETERLAKEYGVKTDKEHIRKCLLSYDEWITKRATCPRCKSFGLQKNMTFFHCLECDAEWKVNRRRDKEVRRMLITA